MLILADAYDSVTDHSNNPHHHLQASKQLAPVHNRAPAQGHGPLGLRTILDAWIYKAADYKNPTANNNDYNFILYKLHLM
jgi:hypothetical protein